MGILLFISNLSMFEKEVIVDGRNHMVGRLASKVAHQLLRGQKIVVVRCESLCFSGSLFRNNIKFHEFLHLANNTNPRRQFKHFRSPSRMFWRIIRGMMPHKTARGAAALQRLKVFEGIPYPYDQKKRMVVPQALKVLRIKSFRHTCKVGDLANQVGWRNKAMVEKLEEKRLAKSQVYYDAKKKKTVARAKQMADGRMGQLNTELKKYGF